jgi:hypothetical protein
MKWKALFVFANDNEFGMIAEKCSDIVAVGGCLNSVVLYSSLTNQNVNIIFNFHV